MGVKKKSEIIFLCHLEKDMALKRMNQEGSQVILNEQHVGGCSSQKSYKSLPDHLLTSLGIHFLISEHSLLHGSIAQITYKRVSVSIMHMFPWLHFHHVCSCPWFLHFCISMLYSCIITLSDILYIFLQHNNNKKLTDWE